MKKILLISVAAAGLLSGVAQAAPAARLPVLSNALAPTALTSLPALPAVSSSRPLAALYPLVNPQFLSNIGRVGSSLITGPLNLPLLGTPTLGKLLNPGQNIIVGLGKVVGPPHPPKDDARSGVISNVGSVKIGPLPPPK